MLPSQSGPQVQDEDDHESAPTGLAMKIEAHRLTKRYGSTVAVDEVGMSSPMIMRSVVGFGDPGRPALREHRRPLLEVGGLLDPEGIVWIRIFMRSLAVEG